MLESDIMMSSSVIVEEFDGVWFVSSNWFVSDNLVILLVVIGLALGLKRFVLILGALNSTLNLESRVFFVFG